MKGFKRTLQIAVTSFLCLALIISCIPASFAEAAVKKPDKPTVTVKATDDGSAAKISIASTKNAKGFKIMVKKPGSKKYVQLTTLSGSDFANYNTVKLEAGKYSFKVKAYNQSGKKKVWGKYSKVVSLTIKDKKSSDTGNVKYISTMSELQNIDPLDTKTKYVLKNDIDMKGFETFRRFQGILDGAGHTLKNLTVPFTFYLSGGTIENLTFDIKLTKVFEIGDYKLIAPIGFLSGGDNFEFAQVINCKSVGEITLTEGGDKMNPDDYNDAINVGGLVAFNPNNYGYVERCLNETSITVKGYPNAAIGGIIGMAGAGTTREVIVECKNAGNIITDTEKLATSYCGIGGIVGNLGTLSIMRDCLNVGSVKSEIAAVNQYASRVGCGLCGSFETPNIKNCVSIGATDTAVAGMKIPSTYLESWSYSSGKRFENVYYGPMSGDMWVWADSPVDVEGMNKLDDITEKSAYKGLDFDNIWIMTDNGPDLRNIPG